MGSVSSRALLNDDEVIQYLSSDKEEVAYAYTGWHGVRMSMTAKAVAKAAKQSNLFDPVVLVTAGESCSSLWKLQKRIAEQLGLIVDADHIDEEEEGEEEIDREVAAGMISRSLAGRTFLLIIDKLLQPRMLDHELRSIGVPVPTTTARWIRCKFLITTTNFQVIRAMNIRDTTAVYSPELESVPWDLGDVSRWDLDGGVYGLLEHIHDEAGDVANTLGISDQVEQVFNCCIYLSLFQQTNGMDAKELMKYYVGEGFITTAQQQQQQQLDGLGGLEGAFRHGEAVLAELCCRYCTVGVIVTQQDTSSSFTASIYSNSKVRRPTLHSAPQ